MCQAFVVRERAPDVNCIKKTEVSFELCSHAAAFSSDAYTCSSCTPFRLNDTSLPPGCSISADNSIYYNDNPNGMNNGNYAAVCYDVSSCEQMHFNFLWNLDNHSLNPFLIRFLKRILLSKSLIRQMLQPANSVELLATRSP